MNWIKANKFLTVFFAVLLIGLGVLGYLFFSAKGDYETADSRYTEQAQEFNRLRHLNPFPNSKNVKALQAQKEDASKAVAAFQAELSAKEFPVEPMAPAAFQDKLKASVDAVKAKAAKNNVEIPVKFYLGFDPYEGQPPAADAAAPLGRQLKTIEWVVNQLISNKITVLRTIARPQLPEETGRRPAPSDKRGERGDKSARELVTKYPFDVTFFCKQQVLANVLNTIIGPKAPQFLIPRAVLVKNQTDKGPARAGADAAGAGAGAFLPPPVAAPAPAPSGAPNSAMAIPAEGTGAPPGAGAPGAPAGGGAAGAPGQITAFIVGEEKLEVTLRLELVDFAEVASK